MLATVLEKIVSMGCMCFYPIVFVLTNMDENGVSLLALRYFEGCPQAMGIWWLVVVSVSGHFFLSFFLGFTIVQQQHIANFNFKWKKSYKM